MKYIQKFQTNNDCYKDGRYITPKGVMVHSTGANNPNLCRYVVAEGTGPNKYNNDWDKPGVGACVHAFIGKFQDGSVGVVQTLPFTKRGWHAASGPKGSANNTHIGFEICEDGLNDANYFQKVYACAVEFTADLCKSYNLDPMKDGVVICHSEGYTRGIASNHGDVMHWFPKFGKNMDTFRKDVKAKMEESKTSVNSIAEKAKAWSVKKGLFVGYPDGSLHWDDNLTREQAAIILYRLEGGK